MDNKPVTVTSTNMQQTTTCSCSVLRRKDGIHMAVPCAEAVIAYTSNMGGVD